MIIDFPTLTTKAPTVTAVTPILTVASSDPKQSTPQAVAVEPPLPVFSRRGKGAWGRYSPGAVVEKL